MAFIAMTLGVESITRVSTDSSNNQATGGASTNPSVTADGRYVAFESAASNLVTGGTTTNDIYKKDTSANTITLVSADTSGSAADGASSNAAISADDGRYIAFQSTATDLITGGNATSDIYRRDTTGNTTILISADTAGGAADGASSNPSITANGRYVAFQSTATDLITGGNATSDIYKRDATNNTTTLASTDSSSTAGNGASSNPVISADDGRYIAFESAATNLVANDTNATTDVFLKDTTTNQTTRVSTADSGTQATGGAAGSTNASISANGRYIAFQSDQTNLVSNDTNGNTDVFVKDTQTNKTTRVSTNSSGTQSSGGNSTKPVISPDGRFVAFTSAATDLVTGDTNAVADIFVKDTQSGGITRLSTDISGTQANGASDNAATASNGKYVAFDSAATNLVTGDTNSLTDVFEVKVDTTAPSSLKISSTTHKSSTKYYKAANVALSWSASDSTGVSGYSYTMNRVKNTTPDTTSEGTGTSKTYTTHFNGAYYFHLRAVDTHSNWSSTKRLQVNIDRYKPRTYARKKFIAKRKGGVARPRIYWRVYDPYTGNKAFVKILIKKKVNAKSYKPVKIVNYKWTRINKVRYYNWRVSSPGIYKYYVLSKDQANNTQHNKATGYVLVK